MVKRLLGLFSAFAVLFYISAPVFAVDVMPGGIPVGIQLDVVDLFTFAKDTCRDWVNIVRHGFDEDVCPMAPQAGGRHKFEAVRTLVNGQIGLYYQCEHCGRNYGEALEEAYTDYVETLPGTTYNSAGAFLWVPGARDFSGNVSLHWYKGDKSINFNNALSLTADFPSYSGTSSIPGTNSGQYTFTAVAYIGDYVLMSHNASYAWAYTPNYCCADFPSLIVPFNGIFTADTSVLPSSSIVSASFSVGKVMPVGRTLPISISAANRSARAPWPRFWVELYTGGSGGNTYDMQTRFSGTGNAGTFGYVQDGQLYQSTVGTIYNETSNVYQNPVTGDTSTVTSWQYDYSDRSYTLTTDDSQQITVTYGDENVTINEGGTTYNVYYLAEEPEDVQEDVSHTHSWVSEVTTPPTCTGTGVRTLTCSECGWQTTEVIPATGHSYSSSVVTREPTCTVSGVRTGTCTICGDEATESIPALGHNYQSVVTLAPSCVASGVRTFTCSRCGDVYTESVLATGHAWQPVLSIPTKYDEVTGELIQAGFTLYRCSNCGEEYRIDAASGGSSLPSASTDGVSTGGASGLDIDPDTGKGFLPTVAQGLNQDLPGVLETVSGWFGFFPDYYGGWAQFLKDGVSCLPAEAQVMISFGFGVMLVLGILLRLAGRR